MEYRVAYAPTVLYRDDDNSAETSSPTMRRKKGSDVRPTTT